MRYYKVIENNELMRIGVGADGVEISKLEYEALLDYIKSLPFEMPVIEDEEVEQ